jgi:hypothetical protein
MEQHFHHHFLEVELLVVDFHFLPPLVDYYLIHRLQNHLDFLLLDYHLDFLNHPLQM